MSAASPVESRLRSTIRVLRKSPAALWIAFVLVHLLLGFQGLTEAGGPLGDIYSVYEYWAKAADQQAVYYGIDKPWVYPIVALVPMILAGIFGFAHYTGAFLGLVFLFDLIAFAALVGWRRPNRPIDAAWWWIGFLLFLGPIALGRIDSISVPVAIVGTVFVASRPRLAAVLLTVATWIKVWPAAMIAAIVIASRARIRVLLTVIVTSAVIVAAALALGAGSNVFSFVSQQTSRTLQIESPTGTIWMWMAFAHVPGAFPYYNETLNTFEVAGPGSLQAAALLTPLLAIVMLVVVILGIVAVQRGSVVTELLPPLALALVSAFIAFNKVVSPQYITWLAVPLLLGLVTNSLGRGKPFRFPATVGLMIAALTQIYYPVLYVDLYALHPLELVVVSMRNILVLVLFVWAVVQLAGLIRPFAAHEVLAESDSDAWLPAVWPFAPRFAQSDEATTHPRTEEDHST